MGEKTPLFEEHKKLGAQIVDFAGWEMPVYYSTPLKEHELVRSEAGIFDVSHMGEIFVEGKQALELVQLLVTRDVSRMEPGQMSLGIMCNEQGGILDDLTVYRFSDEKYMIVVNAGTRKKDLSWIKKHAAEFGCSVRDESDSLAKIDLQGPKTKDILAELTDFDLSKIGFYRFAEFSVTGVACIVSRSGYTGEDGFELYFEGERAPKLWNKLLEAGAQPCGLGARDTLRLECCMPLYGHELTENHSPLQAGYEWTINFEKENFIGMNVLLEQKNKGLAEKLVAFEMVERGIAREGYKILHEEKEIGVVTSGSFSPTLKKNIGMGYVKQEFAGIGQKIGIDVRGKAVGAVTVKKPFYKRNY